MFSILHESSSSHVFVIFNNHVLINIINDEAKLSDQERTLT